VTVENCRIQENIGDSTVGEDRGGDHGIAGRSGPRSPRAGTASPGNFWDGIAFIGANAIIEGNHRRSSRPGSHVTAAGEASSGTVAKIANRSPALE
jgi:hypothetical protein